MTFGKSDSDGVTVWSRLFNDDGMDINIMKRAGGSISLFGTFGNAAVHAIIWDSLDDSAPSEGVQRVIAHLTEMRDGINELLAVALTPADLKDAFSNDWQQTKEIIDRAAIKAMDIPAGQPFRIEDCFENQEN